MSSEMRKEQQHEKAFLYTIFIYNHRREIDRKSTMINENRNSTDRYTYSYTPGSTNVGIDIECPDCYDGIWHLDYKMETPESMVIVHILGGGTWEKAEDFVCGIMETPVFTGTEFSHEYYEIYADYSFDGNVTTREKREGWPQE